MEWRDVPGYPGYQVSERGRLRKASGYELGRRGARYVLSHGGVLVRLTPQELIALAWPPKGEEATPFQPVPAPEPEPVEKPSKAVPEGFVPVPGYPGYHINREGVCIGPKGLPLTLIRPEGPCGGNYILRGIYTPIGRVLDMTFGEGAAIAAGYPAGKPLDIRQQARAKMSNRCSRYERRCHDCGRPTNDYRCPACWARLRGSAAEAEESEWNAL